MTAISHLGTGVFFSLLWVALAAAQAPAAPSSVSPGGLNHAAERERIGRERLAIDEALQRTQAACYQRFAVEDCLRTARRRAREHLAVLRQQESMMDDRERRERAAQRLQSIEERQNTRGAEVPSVIMPRASHPQKPLGVLQRAHPQARQADSAQANQEERRQALQQRAAVERQRQKEKQQAAQERKARVQQRQEQDAARGRKPAAPLVP